MVNAENGPVFLSDRRRSVFRRKKTYKISLVMETEKNNQQKQYPGVGYQDESKSGDGNRQNKSDETRMQGRQAAGKKATKAVDKDDCVCDPCECEPCTCDSRPNEHMEGIDTAYGQCACQQKEVVVLEDDDQGA